MLPCCKVPGRRALALCSQWSAGPAFGVGSRYFPDKFGAIGLRRQFRVDIGTVLLSYANCCAIAQAGRGRILLCERDGPLAAPTDVRRGLRGTGDCAGPRLLICRTLVVQGRLRERARLRE